MSFEWDGQLTYQRDSLQETRRSSILPLLVLLVFLVLAAQYES